ncbi:FtsX-like permease family protein [Lancefieldella parvula]|uniref:FtsX-like permease family protein n=1 Tax=Lancefieldella parvula TaxID=1382 RepID=UPI00361DC09C
MNLLTKIAVGNVRRNLSDFGVYFAALATGACLMYSYAASGDYLFDLVNDESVRSLFVAEANYSLAFGILPFLVFLNVTSYANKFLIRRRLPEFAQYELAGLEKKDVISILRYETILVSGSALIGGIVIGIAISPFVEMIVSWSYALPMKFVVVASPLGAIVTTIIFFITMLVLSRGSKRILKKSTLLQMMTAKKENDSSKPLSISRAIFDACIGVLLLAIVYVVCAQAPFAFIGFMIPFGACAIFGSFFVFRSTLVLLPRVLKKIPSIWYRGLTAFSVRQAEGVARNASKAMTCSAALSSVGMCMFVFAVVLRTQIFEVISSQDMSASDVSGPFGVIVFTCSFYAVVLLVFSSVILAVQQLSLAADNKERYYKLYELGASREILSKSLLTGVLCNFLLPGIFTVIHAIFGLNVIHFMSVEMFQTAIEPSIWPVALLTLFGFVVYFFITYIGAKKNALSMHI